MRHELLRTASWDSYPGKVCEKQIDFTLLGLCSLSKTKFNVEDMLHTSLPGLSGLSGPGVGADAVR
ncbi:hypothetical protein CH63R_11185 [Colletotrichum higginsianum IMI 349063]|uniref:Uncharacterized protein n=1 Tax=Colletotrichum higginsianum (strain IMI 349063) TaxID=759273 RepID=A0A1B7XXJ5_COLHI|nr:hypothetical protein CH63R_11185 [Colletotrichum higginsianum IMI 349063]OBR04482.1 hypothetical protein CH63R_11185 [Colletotrichum higginsianum IMI 349063]GJC99117.1 hypothetical protein ColKHC_07943 [Colletotrichum higginsianum]